MHITAWNDYICPWAYAARPQTQWLRTELEANGAGTVNVRSFELHPDIPLEGRDVRPGGRLDQVFDHIAIECESRGQAFNKPRRTPNSRSILGLAELVSRRHSDHFAAFDEAVATAYWVQGLAIDDPEVVRSLLDDAGLDPDQLMSSEARAEAEKLLADARSAAMDVGATATPSWQIGDLVVTGLHDDAQFRRWIGRILDTQS